MNDIGGTVEEYLALRRALGFKLRGHDRLLADFVSRLEAEGASTVTTALAASWATGRVGVSPNRWAQRLDVVRGFVRYLHALDPANEVPPTDLLARRWRRPAPYLYSQADVDALLLATDSLRTPLRALTYRTLIGVIWVTGMRLGEAIELDRADVDLDLALVTIRQAKFNKSRRLPLHPSTVAALRVYGCQRDLVRPRPSTPGFLISEKGTRLIDACVHTVFRQLVEQAGIRSPSGSRQPRIHDMRHSLAVSCLLDWYRDGSDVAAKMPLLSAYLGHASPVSTYWYLQAAPELLALAAQRLEHPGGGPR